MPLDLPRGIRLRRARPPLGRVEGRPPGVADPTTWVTISTMLVTSRADSPPSLPEATDDPARRPAGPAREARHARPAGDPCRLVPGPRRPDAVPLLGRRRVDRPARPDADAGRPGRHHTLADGHLRPGDDGRPRHAGE